MVADSRSWTFKDGLTVEAWIRPGDLPPSGGRIVDKVTPGGDDGFLLDTWPGRSLRLITALGTLTARTSSRRDTWVHVAAVVDPGAGTPRALPRRRGPRPEDGRGGATTPSP